MIFKQIDDILNGRKTQTRRVVKPSEVFSQWTDGTIVAVFTVLPDPPQPDRYLLRWRLGKTYAIMPKRGAKAIPEARIRITEIRREQLWEITDHDAVAEGVAGVAEYIVLWESINGKKRGARWADNPTVWALTFEVVQNDN